MYNTGEGLSKLNARGKDVEEGKSTGWRIEGIVGISSIGGK